MLPRISSYLVLFAIVLTVSVSGCLGPPMSVEKDSDGDGLFDSTEIELGTDPNSADTDLDGVNDGDEIANGTDPLVNDLDGSIVGELNPLGKVIYHAGPTMGAYSADGKATFLWTFTDEQGFSPSENKFACVTPTKLPNDFWAKYDTREALGDQDWVDKKADNLYIPFNEDGEIYFYLNTERIQGEYGFKICGILDNDYIDEQSYAGDGNEIVVEVAEQGLIVKEKACLMTDSSEYSASYTCYWEFEFADGSEFKCGHLDPPQPYEEMTLADGSISNSLFEIIEEEAGIIESNAILVSSKTGSTIHRGDTWTLCGFSQACGCCKHPNFPAAKTKNGLCINVGVKKGFSETVSIGVNQEHHTYQGDGDPLTYSY